MRGRLFAGCSVRRVTISRSQKESTMIPTLPVEWIPLRDYSGYHHVLGAAPCFVHFGNGNIYFWACEQHDASMEQELAALKSGTGAGLSADQAADLVWVSELRKLLRAA